MMSRNLVDKIQVYILFGIKTGAEIYKDENSLCHLGSPGPSGLKFHFSRKGSWSDYQ